MQQYTLSQNYGIIVATNTICLPHSQMTDVQGNASWPNVPEFPALSPMEKQNKSVIKGTQLTDESLKFVPVAVSVTVNDPFESCRLQRILHQLKQHETNTKLTLELISNLQWNPFISNLQWNLKSLSNRIKRINTTREVCSRGARIILPLAQHWHHSSTVLESFTGITPVQYWNQQSLCF